MIHLKVILKHEMSFWLSPVKQFFTFTLLVYEAFQYFFFHFFTSPVWQLAIEILFFPQTKISQMGEINPLK